MTEKRAGRAAAVAVVAAVVLTHAWIFFFPYHVDDFPQLHEARELTRPGVLLGATHDARGVRGVSSYFRPTLHLAFWLDATLFGFRRAGFHLSSLLLHGATALMLLALGRALRAPRLAVAWALVFAVHPAKVEAVYWIAARGDELVTFFAVVAAWCLVVARTRGSTAAVVGTVVAAIAAMTSKESGMVVPAMLVGFDVLVLRKLGAGRRRWVLDVVLLAAAVATWIVRRDVVGIEGVHYVGLEMELGRESIERAIRRYPLAITAFLTGPLNGSGARLLGMAGLLLWVISVPWRHVSGRAVMAAVGILGLALPPALVLLEAEWVGISRHVYLPAVILCLGLALPFAARAASGVRRAATIAYAMILVMLMGVVATEQSDVAATIGADADFRRELASVHPGDVAEVGVVDMPIWIGFGLPLSLRPPFSDRDLHAEAVDTRAPRTLHRLTRGDRPLMLLRWDGDARRLERVSPVVLPPPDRARLLDVVLDSPSTAAHLGTVVWPRDAPVIELGLVGDGPAIGDAALAFVDENNRTFTSPLPRTSSGPVVIRLALEDRLDWFSLERLAMVTVAGGDLRIVSVKSLVRLPRLELIAPSSGARHSYANDGDLVFTVRDPAAYAAYRLSFTEPVAWSRTVAREHCEIEGDVVRISTAAPALRTADQPASGAMSGPEIMKTLNLASLTLRVTVEALTSDLSGVQARSPSILVTVVP